MASFHHETFTRCPSICPSNLIQRCSTDGGHAEARRRDPCFHGGSWTNNKEAQHEVWRDASLRASEPVELWQAIVGISLQSALDPTLFHHRGRARHLATASNDTAGFPQLCRFTFKSKRAKGSKQNTAPTKHPALTLNMERVPVEIWQQILLKVTEIDVEPIFATSCTPYTFLYVVTQQTRAHKQRRSYLDYRERRSRLRLVCRAWNEYMISTRHRWLHLSNQRSLDEQGRALFKLDVSTPGPGGGVGPVERLSTTITSNALATPILSWTSHILKRPTNHSPLRAYILRLLTTHVQGYNPFDDLVGTTPAAAAAGYTNTTLHALSIMTPFNSTAHIAFSQISATFLHLRALFLVNVNGTLQQTPQQTLALPRLELLHVDNTPCTFSTFSMFPVHAWDTPALRHAHLGEMSTAAQVAAVRDGFLRRYAPQLESLTLLGPSYRSASFVDLPPGFWDEFRALRLLGLRATTMKGKDWSGWSIVPPTTHPLRYVVCWSPSTAESTVESVRQRWTYHQGVRLVAAHQFTSTYHLVRDIRDEQWIAKMEETDGILPEL
jgi:hypothetical protein